MDRNLLPIPVGRFSGDQWYKPEWVDDCEVHHWPQALLYYSHSTGGRQWQRPTKWIFSWPVSDTKLISQTSIRTLLQNKTHRSKTKLNGVLLSVKVMSEDNLPEDLKAPKVQILASSLPCVGWTHPWSLQTAKAQIIVDVQPLGMVHA